MIFSGSEPIALINKIKTIFALTFFTKRDWNKNQRTKTKPKDNMDSRLKANTVSLFYLLR